MRPGHPHRARHATRVSALLVFALAIAGAVAAAHLLRLRVNLSPSLPEGLYRGVERPLARRSLVLACLPLPVARLALRRGYLPEGACPGGAAPLGKIVLALSGDVVDVRDGAVVVNDRPVPRSQIAAVDSRGRALPRLARRRFRLRAGEVWLFSPYDDRSFDSRYFGPVPEEAIVSTIAPLLVRDRTAPAGFRLAPLRSRTS
jgi:conjugative transfer signal peptidase TraF